MICGVQLDDETLKELGGQQSTKGIGARSSSTERRQVHLVGFKITHESKSTKQKPTFVLALRSFLGFSPVFLAPFLILTHSRITSFTANYSYCIR